MFTEYYQNIDSFNVPKTAVSNKLTNNEYSFFACMNSKNLLEIEKLGVELLKKYEKFVVIGCGGSINSGITFNEINPANIIFIDNIDPYSTTKKIAEISNPEKTCVIVISKSGKSEEILVLYDIIIKKFKKTAEKLGQDNFLIITQLDQNPLHKLAIKNGNNLIPHASDIGGRFSYLSVVGLLIAKIAGLDIYEIQRGAQKSISEYLKNGTAKNIYCHQIAQEIKNGSLYANICMIYNDQLMPFQVWLQQLWAESLGKDNLGSIPVAFSGTRDQHSQLQLYLANPKGKTFTLIRCEQLSGGNNKLKDAYHAHASNVLNSIQKTEQVCREIVLTELDAYHLGILMTNMVIETLICAEYMQVNPFGQSKVEEIKNKRLEDII
ncbi:MAG: hypothetical protein VX335_05345 [Pseudomonadota bacterium]|nr:hypothetical protein [Pseudomonadota bacterium]